MPARLRGALDVAKVLSLSPDVPIIMPVRRWARFMGVSRSTAVRYLDELAAWGVIGLELGKTTWSSHPSGVANRVWVLREPGRPQERPMSRDARAQMLRRRLRG